jgi:hypothetical protein
VALYQAERNANGLDLLTEQWNRSNACGSQGFNALDLLIAIQRLQLKERKKHREALNKRIWCGNQMWCMLWDAYQHTNQCNEWDLKSKSQSGQCMRARQRTVGINTGKSKMNFIFNLQLRHCSCTTGALPGHEFGSNKSLSYSDFRKDSESRLWFSWKRL